jgi:hypothetical protein
MIWLTWRQFRTQAVVALAALAALAIYLVILGYQMRHAYTTDIVGCRPAGCAGALHDFEEAYGTQVALIGALLLGVPALIGVFWGAPLITRELEEKTDRLVWNQSVTRTRWLAVKLTLLTLISTAVTGLYSLLLTWSASRYDQLIGERCLVPGLMESIKPGTRQMAVPGLRRARWTSSCRRACRQSVLVTPRLRPRNTVAKVGSLAADSNRMTNARNCGSAAAWNINRLNSPGHQPAPSRLRRRKNAAASSQPGTAGRRQRMTPRRAAGEQFGRQPDRPDPFELGDLGDLGRQRLQAQRARVGLRRAWLIGSREEVEFVPEAGGSGAAVGGRR